MKNFTQRTITGLTFVVIISACIILNQFAFASVFAVITVIGLIEFYNLASSANARPFKYAGVIAGLILFVGNFLFAAGCIRLEYLLGLVLMIFLFFFAGLIKWNANIISSTGITLLGIFYISAPLSMLAYFCYLGENGAEYKSGLLLGYLIILWLFDTGAYITGSLAGKHKLMERISPAKTWEGLAGGLIISIGVAFILSLIFKIVTRTDWVIISIITAITGTLGDLFESAIKRNASVKDSGNILPGHGGILDRIDSVLLSAPFVSLFLLIRNYY